MFAKLKKARYLEPLVIFGAALVVFLIAAEIEAFEALAEFMEEHEQWQLDEAFLALVTIGIAGYIYAFRRQVEKRKEMEIRLQAENDLDWLSKHDNLTELPNRHYLSEFVQRLEADSDTAIQQHFGLISIDLDGFKKANDLLGHTGGDKLLQEVTARIKDNDAVNLVFRLGGDEFLVITELEKSPDTYSAAEHIHSAITKPFIIDGITNNIGASIGVSRFPLDSPILDEAIHCSDLAMYHAKRAGKNVVEFTKSMSETNLRRSVLEQDLLAALSEGEIKPHYQPLFDLASNEIRGFEALARWNRPGHGFVAPEKFISIAEDIGAITDLSDQILRQACIDARKWPDDLILSFNLSPLQLSDRMVSERILKVLSETGFAADRLEVEITESALVLDIDTTTKILKELNAAGVRIALDDFGTGYSNLSQLSKLQFDRIKIDREFINTFITDGKQMNIVKTILSLGEGLGIRITAEGIEEVEQLAVLKDLGCDCGQGFYLGYPADAAQTQDFLAQQYALPSQTAA
ncbi:MAG: EAL domain-containing protein [Roseibium sp.]